MAGSMKDIKLRIKSVESTMQITKAMELVASSKMRRAKERVEHSRPYFETLYESLTKIAAADPRARNPYLRRDDIKRTLLVVIAGGRGLAGVWLINEPDAHRWVLCNQTACCFGGVIRAAIVDDDDLKILECLTNNTFNCFREQVSIIKAWDDD